MARRWRLHGLVPTAAWSRALSISIAIQPNFTASTGAMHAAVGLVRDHDLMTIVLLHDARGLEQEKR